MISAPRCVSQHNPKVSIELTVQNRTSDMNPCGNSRIETDIAMIVSDRAYKSGEISYVSIGQSYNIWMLLQQTKLQERTTVSL